MQPAVYFVVHHAIRSKLVVSLLERMAGTTGFEPVSQLLLALYLAPERQPMHEGAGSAAERHEATRDWAVD